jgi:hypothetical protein
MSRDALVVGINHYQYLPPLQAPAHDAESVACCLESFGECRVARMPEAIKANKACISLQSGVTAQMLEEALIKLFKPPGKNIPQQAIFYYSGHGFQRHAGIQEGYLATSDVNPEAGIYGVSLYWLRRLLQESPVRQRVILLDCCHSGEFFNILEADPGSRAGTDRLFMAASREYEAAYESLEGSHSVFTQALLSGLNPYKVKGGIVNGHHLIHIVNNDLKGELQQPLFESSGSEIILTRVTGAKAALQSCPLTLVDRLKHMRFGYCPFLGHQPFDTAHAEFFFGRETITQQLFNLTENSRLCAVVGASGIGKTSLLKAGLIPYLQGQGPDVATNPPDIRYLVPTDHPLQQLAEAFVSPQVKGLQRAEEIRQAESFLHQGAPGFVRLVQAVTGMGLSQPGQLRPMVLMVDQFEQLLPFEVSQGFDQERRLVFDCLVEAARQTTLPIKVVLGIRSDCLERLQPFADLYRLVCQHYLVVPQMTYDQVKSTITGPLEKIGLKYDANLVYMLMLDAGGAPVDLSSLQLALKELWLQREHHAQGHDVPRLTLEAYTNTGGIRGFLSHHAGAVFDGLPETDQPIAQRLFTSLCALGDGPTDSRRQAQLCELATPAVPETQVLAVLEKLIAARLVVAQGLPNRQLPANPGQGVQTMAVPGWSTTTPTVTETRGTALAELFQTKPDVSDSQPLEICPPYYEIAHDALLRHWPQLQDWLHQYRPMLKTQQSLEASALEWHYQNRPSHPDYFLSPSRLQDAKTFQAKHPEQLSVVATTYLEACDRYLHRNRRKQWLISLLIPLSMAFGMATAYGHSVLLGSRSPSPASRITESAADPAVPSFQLTPSADDRATPPFPPEQQSPQPHPPAWPRMIRNGLSVIPGYLPTGTAPSGERAARAMQPLGSGLLAAQPTRELFEPAMATLATPSPWQSLPVDGVTVLTQPSLSPSSSLPMVASSVSRAVALGQEPSATASDIRGLSLAQGITDNLPVDKIAEWISANDPQIKIQLWCVHTQTEPVCFTTEDQSHQGG